MIISVDAENIFDKIQHLMIFLILRKLETETNYHKPISNAFLQRWRTGKDINSHCFFSTLYWSS